MQFDNSDYIRFNEKMERMKTLRGESDIFTDWCNPNDKCVWFLAHSHKIRLRRGEEMMLSTLAEYELSFKLSPVERSKRALSKFDLAKRVISESIRVVSHSSTLHSTFPFLVQMQCIGALSHCMEFVKGTQMITVCSLVWHFLILQPLLEFALCPVESPTIDSREHDIREWMKVLRTKTFISKHVKFPESQLNVVQSNSISNLVVKMMKLSSPLP